MVEKSQKVLGFMARNCSEFKNLTALRTLCMTLIRSNLEHAPVVYREQSRYPVKGISNNILLHKFDMESLEMTRCLASARLYNRIVQGKIDSPYRYFNFQYRVSVRGSVRSSILQIIEQTSV